MSLQRVEHAEGYVLHQQPWGDSGRIVELFCREHGRISVFARGARGPRARLAGVLQPFTPLLVSWAGRGEAPRLTGAEPDLRQAHLPMPAAQLLSAYYVTELIMKLTLRHDPQPELFEHYAAVLAGLRGASEPGCALRRFEKRLLDTLGYGIPGLKEEQFDIPASAEQLRPVLRAALDQCLEGRALKTRVVAKSLLGFRRAGR